MTTKYEITIINNNEEVIYKTDDVKSVIKTVVEAGEDGAYCKVMEGDKCSVMINNPEGLPDYLSDEMAVEMMMLVCEAMFS